jgi:hypothetical protein
MKYIFNMYVLDIARIKIFILYMVKLYKILGMREYILIVYSKLRCPCK